MSRRWGESNKQFSLVPGLAGLSEPGGPAADFKNLKKKKEKKKVVFAYGLYI